MKIHHCKCHKRPYTVCPQCHAEYCLSTWPTCPRLSWHPAHGVNAEDTGHRYARLHRSSVLKAGIVEI